MKLSERLAQAEDALRETREVCDGLLQASIEEKHCADGAAVVDNQVLASAFQARADSYMDAHLALQNRVRECEADVAALRRQLGRTP